MKQSQSFNSQTQTLQKPVDSDTNIKASDGEDFGPVSLKDNEVPVVPTNFQKPNDQASINDVQVKQQDEESSVSIGPGKENASLEVQDLQAKPTLQADAVPAKGSQGMINDSDDDTRRNVNADPNLIQGNLLGSNTNMDNQYDAESAANIKPEEEPKINKPAEQPHGSRPLPKPKESDKPKEPYNLEKQDDPRRMN